MGKCLLLEDAGGHLRALAGPLRAAGLEVVRPAEDLESFCAREAEGGLMLLGAGEGTLKALLLAERYPVARLALVGCPLRPRAGVRASRLRRRAEHNLFSVVAELLVIQPAADPRMLPRGADIVLGGVSARVKRRVEMGRDFDDLWANCLQPLTEIVLHFLTAPPAAKTLAKRCNS